MVSMAHRGLKALPEYLVLKDFKGHKALKVRKVITVKFVFHLTMRQCNFKIGSDGKDGSDGTNGKDGTPGVAGTASLSTNFKFNSQNRNEKYLIRKNSINELHF